MNIISLIFDDFSYDTINESTLSPEISLTLEKTKQVVHSSCIFSDAFITLQSKAEGYKKYEWFNIYEHSFLENKARKDANKIAKEILSKFNINLLEGTENLLGCKISAIDSIKSDNFLSNLNETVYKFEKHLYNHNCGLNHWFRLLSKNIPNYDTKIELDQKFKSKFENILATNSHYALESLLDNSTIGITEIITDLFVQNKDFHFLDSTIILLESHLVSLQNKNFPITVTSHIDSCIKILTHNIINNYTTNVTHTEFISNIITHNNFPLDSKKYVIDKFLEVLSSTTSNLLLFSPKVFQDFESIIPNLIDKENTLLLLAYAAKKNIYKVNYGSLRYFDELLFSGKHTELVIHIISSSIDYSLSKSNARYDTIENYIANIFDHGYKLPVDIVSKIIDLYDKDQTYFSNILVQVIELYYDSDPYILEDLLSTLIDILTINEISFKTIKEICFMISRLFDVNVKLPKNILELFTKFLNSTDLKVKTVIIRLYEKLSRANFKVNNVQIIELNKNIVGFLGSKNINEQIIFLQSLVNLTNEANTKELEPLFKRVILQRNTSLLQIVLNGLHRNDYNISFSEEELEVIQAANDTAPYILTTSDRRTLESQLLNINSPILFDRNNIKLFLEENIKIDNGIDLINLLNFIMHHKVDANILAKLISEPITLRNLYAELMQHILTRTIGDKQNLQQYIQFIPKQIEILYKAGWSVEDLRISLSILNSDNISYFVRILERIANYSMSSKTIDQDGFTVPEILITQAPDKWDSYIWRLYRDNDFYIPYDTETLLQKLEQDNKGKIDISYYRTKLSEIKELENTWYYKIQFNAQSILFKDSEEQLDTNSRKCNALRQNYIIKTTAFGFYQQSKRWYEEAITRDNIIDVYHDGKAIFFWTLEGKKIIIDNSNSDSYERLENILLYQQPVHLDDMKFIYQQTSKYGYNDLRFWSPEDFITWKNSIKRVDDKNLAEILVVLKQVAYNTVLHKKFYPRDIQIIAVLSLLQSKTGMFAQVETGGGKSLIIDLFSTIMVIDNHIVDIVTSSRELAITAAQKEKPFYDALGISVSHNNENDTKGGKTCYLSKVNYGDMLNFGADDLRNIEFGTRNKRGYDVVIIDEGDNLLIDLNSMMVRLNSRTPSLFYLQQALIYIWSLHPEAYYQGIKKCNHIEFKEASVQECAEFLKLYLEKYIREDLLDDKIPLDNRPVTIPSNLKDFVNDQISNWASALVTALSYEEKIDYTVAIDEHKEIQTIKPVDYKNSGTVHNRMTWGEGVSQFLSLKHGLYLNAEELIGLFISYIGYFTKYKGRIYGLTGTLGTKTHTNFLNEFYGVDFVHIPEFKKNKKVIFPEIITYSRKEWINNIIDITFKRSNIDSRSVLIITKTIKDADDIYAKLVKNNYPEEKLVKYTNGTEEERERVENGEFGEGYVIITTTLGSRGCDIKISKIVEIYGGLHVIATFFPDSVRLWHQIIGRGGRKGESGSAQLVIINDGTHSYNNITCTDIDCFNNERKEKEKIKFNYELQCGLPKIKLQDALYNKFQELELKINSPTGYTINTIGNDNNNFTSFSLQNNQIYLYCDESKIIHLAAISPNGARFNLPISSTLEILNKEAADHIGVILIDKKNSEGFNKQDLDLIHFIATMNGISKENTRLTRIKALLDDQIDLCLKAQGYHSSKKFENFNMKLSFEKDCETLTGLSKANQDNNVDLFNKLEHIQNKKEKPWQKVLALHTTDTNQKNLYKLWKEDLALYNNPAKTSQLVSLWQIWFYNQQPSLTEFGRVCDTNNKTVAATQFKALEDKLYLNFIDFANDVERKYHSNDFYNEPKYLLDQAAHYYSILESESYKISTYNSNGHPSWQSIFGLPEYEHPLEKALDSIAKAIDLDKPLAWSAYQYQAVIRLIKEVPNIWHENHATKAQEVKYATYFDLTYAVNGLQKYISQIDAMMLRLATLGLIDVKSELVAQYNYKHKFLTQAEASMMKSIDLIISIINDPMKMLKLGKQTDVYDLARNVDTASSYQESPLAPYIQNSTTIAEISTIYANNTGISLNVMDDLMFAHGFLLIDFETYQLQEKEKDWTGTILSGVLGTMQIIGGIALIGVGGPFVGSFGMSMMMSGIGDCVASFMSISEGKAIDVNGYFKSKVTTYAIAVVTAGIMKMTSRLMEAEKFKELTKASDLTGKNPMEIFKAALHSYAVNTAIGMGAGYVANKIAKSNDGDVENKARAAVDWLLNHYAQDLKVIFAADEINGYRNIKSELEREAFIIVMNCQRKFHDTLTNVGKAAASTVAGLGDNPWVSGGVNAVAATSLGLIKVSGFAGEFKNDFGLYIANTADSVKRPTSDLMADKLKHAYGQAVSEKIMLDLRKSYMNDNGAVYNFVDDSSNIDYSESKCNEISGSFSVDAKDLKEICNKIAEEYEHYITSLKQNLIGILFGQMRISMREDLIRPLTNEAGQAIRTGVTYWLSELKKEEEEKKAKKAKENINAKVKFGGEEREAEVYAGDIRTESQKGNSDKDSLDQQQSKIASQVKHDLKSQYGDNVVNAAEANAEKRLASFANLKEGSYTIKNGEIEIDLPRKNILLASNGAILSDAGPSIDMSDLKVKFKIISAAEAKALGKAALRVGKVFVRINPIANALITAYEVGDYLYKNRDTIKGLYGDTVNFAKKAIENAETTVYNKQQKASELRKQRQEATPDVGVTPPNGPDWEPDDDKNKHKEWEVKEYDKSMLHNKHGKFLRDPKSVSENGRRLWWTKDNAEHSGQWNPKLEGSKWKVYEEAKDGLHWYRDADKYGNFIPKHKSNVGKFIPWKELRGIHVNKS